MSGLFAGRLEVNLSFTSALETLLTPQRALTHFGHLLSMKAMQEEAFGITALTDDAEQVGPGPQTARAHHITYKTPCKQERHAKNGN